MNNYKCNDNIRKEMDVRDMDEKIETSKLNKRLEHSKRIADN
jgi:hypothetical protein